MNQNWEDIRQKTPGQWKNEVGKAAEKMNIVRLKEECETKSRGETKQKTKTKFVMNKVNDCDFERKPDNFIIKNHSITHTRALIMGRYGMLKWANNFSHGHGTRNCDVCNVVDDESHRMNECIKWGGINLADKTEKISFNDIYLDDYHRCLAVVVLILSIWDLENGKNEMRRSM